MKLYSGDRTIDGIKVLVDSKSLPDRVELKCYSTGGLEWGYKGEGPMQLSFALLFDHTGDVNFSIKNAELFMNSVVVEFQNDWSITSDKIQAWLQRNPSNF